MPDKKVLIKTKDFVAVEDAITYIVENHSNLSVSISRLRIEDNLLEIVLCFTGEGDDIFKAVLFLKKTPSIRLEEIYK